MWQNTHVPTTYHLLVDVALKFAGAHFVASIAMRARMAMNGMPLVDATALTATFVMCLYVITMAANVRNIAKRISLSSSPAPHFWRSFFLAKYRNL